MLVACGSSSTVAVQDAGTDASAQCYPTQVEACTCPDGHTGRAVCTSDSKHGGCDCSLVQAADAGGDDVDADMDAGAPDVDAALPQVGFGQACVGACENDICAGNCRALPDTVYGGTRTQICLSTDTGGTPNMKDHCTFICRGSPQDMDGNKDAFCVALNGTCADEFNICFPR